MTALLATFKSAVRPLIPRPFIASYHRALAIIAAAACGFPSRRMLTIGVTGTKGKSTVCYLTARVFEQGGRRVGMTTTALFKLGPQEWLNRTKMTMLGRFSLQRLLRRMVRRRIEAVIVESSSEGLAQWRHQGIAYDVAVFTNLTPEHIESHGSFENYRAAKGRLFAALGAGRRRAKRLGGAAVPSVAVANADDANASFFLAFPADRRWTFGTGPAPAGVDGHVRVENLVLSEDGSTFTVDGVALELRLLGRSNAMNAAAAIAVARSQGFGLRTIAEALAEVRGIPGRFERIDEGQEFSVIVDYAHEPESMKQLFEAVRVLPHQRIIHVFGSTGGGRDVSRRPVIGEISARNADVTIVTTDDPYDDDPATISRQVIAGAKKAGKRSDKDLFDVLDRKEAIRLAVRLAKPGDLILVTGKGSEQVMALGRGKRIPWDDREIVRSAIHTLGRRLQMPGAG